MKGLFRRHQHTALRCMYVWHVRVIRGCSQDDEWIQATACNGPCNGSCNDSCNGSCNGRVLQRRRRRRGVSA